jgi:hypothetical protein
MAIPYVRNCTGSPQQDIFSKHGTAHDIPRIRNYARNLRRRWSRSERTSPIDCCHALFAVLAMALSRFLMGRADGKYLTLPIKMLQ